MDLGFSGFCFGDTWLMAMFWCVGFMLPVGFGFWRLLCCSLLVCLEVRFALGGLVLIYVVLIVVIWFRCWVVSVFWPAWWLGFAG